VGLRARRHVGERDVLALDEHNGAAAGVREVLLPPGTAIDELRLHRAGLAAEKDDAVHEVLLRLLHGHDGVDARFGARVRERLQLDIATRQLVTAYWRRAALSELARRMPMSIESACDRQRSTCGDGGPRSLPDFALVTHAGRRGAEIRRSGRRALPPLPQATTAQP
jgi:hypothetical protein